jgi:MFS transporter, NRE family, putaive nickel resistance protein
MPFLFRWRLFQSLHNPAFRELYFAQTINLLGDACTWLGLALLAFELGGEKAGGILAIALTLRVTAFVVLSPIAGVLADRVDRKPILVITHLLRMVLVYCLIFIQQLWQFYLIVLLLNCCGAFFTPTYKACIPLVTEGEETRQAIALSSITYQLLGVLGPGLAGIFAAFFGARTVFFWDGITFLIAATLIGRLPRALRVENDPADLEPPHKTTGQKISEVLKDLKAGTWPLLVDPVLRHLLAMQLVGAIAGAEILVNTIGRVQGFLQLGRAEYGWVMAALGLGATLGAIFYSYNQQKFSGLKIASAGALFMTVALLAASMANLSGLMLLWLLAGAGQSAIDIPAQATIGQRIAPELQGRVYGAHFAWSHLWWAIGYPLAGFLGQHYHQNAFLLGGLVGIAGLLLLSGWRPQRWERDGLWHEHQHSHDLQHHHHHPLSLITHAHLHYHGQQDGH